ncbi:MAG TPA: hypothetical protein VJA66_13555, partial [Thermoanaerobaculia bacterium]
MQYLIRKWRCKKCGRANATEVAFDGSAICDHCALATKIQASNARGRETPDQLASFIEADATSRQGEWARGESLAAEAVSRPAPQLATRLADRLDLAPIAAL